MLLRPWPISTDHFTYDAETRRFVGEASTLVGNRNCPGPLPRMGRVFDDACDVGFTLVSARTREAVVCCMDGEVRDAEGDLLYTRFLPVGAHGHPHAGRFEVRIYND